MRPAKPTPAGATALAAGADTSPAEPPTVTAPIDVPVPGEAGASGLRYGSDAVVEVLRRLGVEYATLLPGSTLRGLHDSAVNYGGNRQPQLLLCPQEQAAAAIARGYARATGRPMAVLLHNIVGLLQASMAIYDAWCDRVPVVVIGGSGPADAARRRPWIDWIHTANVQGNMVRDFTKWDDQPASVASFPESLLRAYRMAVTEPPGPVYVSLDVALQEEPVPPSFELPDPAWYRPAPPAQPPAEEVQRAAQLLVGAQRPVVLADRVGRTAGAFHDLVRLAEMLALPVVDSGFWWHNFPTPHRLDFAGYERELLADADLVLALDVVDLAGRLRRAPAAGSSGRPHATIVHISNDELVHRGLAADYQALPVVDLPLLASPRTALPALLAACGALQGEGVQQRVAHRLSILAGRQATLRQAQRDYVDKQCAGPGLTDTQLWVALWDVIRDVDFVLTANAGSPRLRAPGVLCLPTPECNLAGVGGGALQGLGVSVGAALALKGRGRFPVAVLGDGAYLHGLQALWTATRYRVPLLVVIANNRSYCNDELHQEQVARTRGRPAANTWIAMRMESPTIDLATGARSFGAVGIGPITTAEALPPALRQAKVVVAEGGVAVVDVHIDNREAGY